MRCSRVPASGSLPIRVRVAGGASLRHRGFAAALARFEEEGCVPTIQSRRVSGFTTSIFGEMSMLAQRHQAINLGQGFPDFPGPAVIKQAANAAIDANLNQYPPSPGLPRLRQALAAQWEHDHGRAVDWQSEVSITSGATEGLYALTQAILDPGDRVLLIEPAYDAYLADVVMAGAEAIPVRLRPPATPDARWSLDETALREAFAHGPKLLLLNTPHNPTGMVFTRAELALIAELCQAHDTLVISDEVYDRMVYDDARHIPLATLPGMWERTITLGSTGKTFGVTGWKVGWAIGAAPINQALRQAKQWITFTTPTPLQEATAVAIEQAPANGYYDQLHAEYTARRDLLRDLLQTAGLTPLPVEGAYFISCDVRGFGHTNDREFCRWLIREAGVAAIPSSIFYSREADLPHIARFCFAKQHATLLAAGERLRQVATWAVGA
jgi:aspartate/methionine/tyrosine aminotransferase